MRTDHALQAAVLERLDFDPAINSSHIGVSARDGFVTLSGHVPSVGESVGAERAAGRVAGVKAVVNDLVVELPGNLQTSDEKVAEQAYARLTSNLAVPADRIHLAVKDGIVTLHGDVDWNYQREAAVEDLRKLGSIRGIVNNVEIKSPVAPDQVQKRVRSALMQIAPGDADKIDIQVDGSNVILSGEVTSWHEKELAESATWCVPGVSQVMNRISVV